jgi:hypothetical protein
MLIVTKIVAIFIENPVELLLFFRKSIISAGAWHYYYSISLLLNYLLGPFVHYQFHSLNGGVGGGAGGAGVFFPAAFVALVFRFFLPEVSKYNAWLFVVLAQLFCLGVLGLYQSVGI